MASNDTGIAVGLKKGFLVTERKPRSRPAQHRKQSERVKIIREVVREVTGLAPYEKRVIELLRGGGNNPLKRAMKFAKKRLGTQTRAKKKVNEMQNYMSKTQQQARPVQKQQKKKK